MQMGFFHCFGIHFTLLLLFLKNCFVSDKVCLLGDNFCYSYGRMTLFETHRKYFGYFSAFWMCKAATC